VGAFISFVEHTFTIRNLYLNSVQVYIYLALVQLSLHYTINITGSSLCDNGDLFMLYAQCSIFCCVFYSFIANLASENNMGNKIMCWSNSKYSYYLQRSLKNNNMQTHMPMIKDHTHC